MKLVTSDKMGLINWSFLSLLLYRGVCQVKSRHLSERLNYTKEHYLCCAAYMIYTNVVEESKEK